MWCSGSFDFGNLGCSSNVRQESERPKTTASELSQNHSFTLYPNPVAEQLTVQGSEDWWFDVRRWLIGQQEADFYERTVAGGAIQWDDNKSYVMPIPTSEINTNTVIRQNPGY